MKTTPERFGEAFERARHHWKRLAGEALMVASPRTTTAFTVAISREAGAGASEVAREVGARLEWPVYDREIIEIIESETGLRADLLKSVDEKQSHWLADCLNAFAQTKSISSAAYAHHLAETLLALAAHGRCVVVGRGATVILPGATTLRVRLMAPLPSRIARLAEQRNVAPQAAERLVKEIDCQRSEFVRSHFHKDVADVHLHDLALNTSRIAPAEAASLIVAALRQMEQVANSCGGKDFAGKIKA